MALQPLNSVDFDTIWAANGEYNALQRKIKTLVKMLCVYEIWRVWVTYYEIGHWNFVSLLHFTGLYSTF